LVIDATTMSLLYQFHQYIFGAVLRLDKYGMAFNPQEAPANILVIPLRKGKSILITPP
jgi:hypothetical protein